MTTTAAVTDLNQINKENPHKPITRQQERKGAAAATAFDGWQNKSAIGDKWQRHRNKLAGRLHLLMSWPRAGGLKWSVMVNGGRLLQDWQAGLKSRLPPGRAHISAAAVPPSHLWKGSSWGETDTNSDPLLMTNSRCWSARAAHSELQHTLALAQGLLERDALTCPSWIHSRAKGLLSWRLLACFSAITWFTLSSSSTPRSQSRISSSLLSLILYYVCL